MKALARLAKDESGATAVEYGLIVALIAAIIVIIVLALGRRVCNGFSTVNSGMQTGGM